MTRRLPSGEKYAFVIHRFGRDGQWYCDGEPIPNRAICRLYSRAMTISADGRGRLELGEDKAWVEIEDTPWVVTQVDGDPTRGFTLHLNDETTEPLDPSTLTVGADDVLYTRVKHGQRVRFGVWRRERGTPTC